MNFLQSLDDRLYLLINSLSGHSPFLDVLFSLPNVSNLVKAGPVGAALFYAWFSGQGPNRVRRRSILMVTLVSLALIVGITKTLGSTIFVPRPLVRSVPMLQLEQNKFVLEKPMPSRVPLLGANRERFEALDQGTVTANDLASFPSDHAAFFFPLALGILLACRRAGVFALAWTCIVILLTRIISGMHSPFDVVVGAGIGTGVLLLMLLIATRLLKRTVDRMAEWTIRREALAASFLFLVTYAAVNVLEDLKQVGNALLPLAKGARSLLAALLALFLTGCGGDRSAALVMLDPHWSAEVVATERNGITSPDGLRWAGNRLLIADEGGHAVRSWAQNQKISTLAGRRNGIGAPEDVDQDNAGNVYFTDDKRGGLWRTDPRGSTTHLAANVGATEGIVRAPSGRMLVGDHEGRVLSIGSGGDVRTLIPASAGIHVAESLAVAPDGSLFIGDNDVDTLYVREQDGAIRVAVPAAEGFSPEGLYHSGRALFITDRKNGKLYRYTPEEGLKTLIVFAGDLAKIQGIAGDPQGNLYVTIQADIREGRGYILRLSPIGREERQPS